MKIDYKNKNVINDEIYIHDSIFEGFSYKEEEKKIVIELENYCLKKSFKLQFCNALIFNCEMCEFWGKSPNILDWEVSKDEPLIQKMKKKQKDNNELYWTSLVDLEKSYVESRITLTSGDTIEIVCEYIEFEEENL